MSGVLMVPVFQSACLMGSLWSSTTLPTFQLSRSTLPKLLPALGYWGRKLGAVLRVMEARATRSQGHWKECQKIPMSTMMAHGQQQSKLGTYTFSSVMVAILIKGFLSWTRYPIYHIPSRGRVKELSASFLTYHTISSSFEDHIPRDVKKGATSEAGTSRRISRKVSKHISLEPFGLASYKMQGVLFARPEAGDQEKLSTLYGAADSWLKQLRFFHDDFDYFRTHST